MVTPTPTRSWVLSQVNGYVPWSRKGGATVTTPNDPLPVHPTHCRDSLIDDVCAVAAGLATARRPGNRYPFDPHEHITTWTACHAATAVELLACMLECEGEYQHAPLSKIMTRLSQVRRHILATRHPVT